MKRRVAELEGALLDRAVGMASGDKYAEHPEAMVYEYSSDWHFGGPIIEREELCLIRNAWDWRAGLEFDAYVEYGGEPVIELKGEQIGPTPLVAAMRAYVAKKFGDEIELP